MARNDSIDRKKALASFLDIDGDIKAKAQDACIEEASDWFRDLDDDDLYSYLKGRFDVSFSEDLGVWNFEGETGLSSEEAKDRASVFYDSDTWMAIYSEFINKGREEAVLEEKYEELLDDEIEEERDNTFSYGREEYLVLTDYEADDAFKESLEELFDDIGIDMVRDPSRWIDDEKFFNDISSSQEEMIADSPDSYTSFFDIDEMKDDIKKDFEKRGIKSDFLKGIDMDWDEYYEEELERGSEEENGKIDEDVLLHNFLDACEEAIDDLDEDDTVNLIKDYGDIWDYTSDATDAYFKDPGSAIDYLENLYGKEIPKEVIKNYFDLDACIEDIKSEDGRGPTLAGYDGDEYQEGDFYIYRTN